MSNNNFFDTSDEEAVNLIYNSCKKNIIGYLKTSDLIVYLQNSTPYINDNVTNDLQHHFDPFQTDPEIDCFAFRKLMFSWIQSVREHQSYQPLHSPKKNYNTVEVTYESHYDTFNESSVVTPPDHTDIKELRDRMGVVEEKNRRLLEEKDVIVSMADDFAKQQNSDLETVIKRQKSELDDLRQEVRELEGGRGRLQVVQTDNDELEAVVKNLETQQEQLKTHISSLQTKLEQEERRREEGQEVVEKAKKEVTEVKEEKLRCEKNRDMYKTLYFEKSGEIEHLEDKINTLNMSIETMKKETNEMKVRLDECAADKRFNLDMSGSDCLDTSLLHIASPHLPINIVSNKTLNNSIATHHLPKLTPFKNTPNSLCSELRHSLLASSAFPSPLRDKELEEMLHDEDDGEEDDLGNCEEDDGDAEKDPSQPQYLVRLEEKRVEMMRKLNHLIVVALEERGGWTEGRRQEDKKEGVMGMKENGGVMEWGDGRKTETLRRHITDEVVAAIKAKLDAELNYIQLKSNFSQQISSFESQQTSMREMIRDLEEEVRNKEEEFVLEQSELTREMVALRHSREKWVDKNGELRTKVGDLNNKVNELEATVEALETRKDELERVVERELKLKGDEEEVLRGVLEEKEENIETLHRCIEKLNAQVVMLESRKPPNKPINPNVKALEWKETPVCDCHMRLNERNMGEYGQGDARPYLIQHSPDTIQWRWVKRIMLIALFLSLLYNFVTNPIITYQYPKITPI